MAETPRTDGPDEPDPPSRKKRPGASTQMFGSLDDPKDEASQSSEADAPDPAPPKPLDAAAQATLEAAPTVGIPVITEAAVRAAESGDDAARSGRGDSRTTQKSPSVPSILKSRGLTPGSLAPRNSPRSVTPKDAPRDLTPRDRTPITDPPSGAMKTGPLNLRIPPPGGLPEDPTIAEEEESEIDDDDSIDDSIEQSIGPLDDDDEGLSPLEAEPTQAAAMLPSGMPVPPDDPRVEPEGRLSTNPGSSTDPGGSTDPGSSTDPGDDDDAKDDEPAFRPATGFDLDDEDDEDPFGDLQPGSKLGGRYVLEKVLGRGAMGVVFEASHSVIGKRVAVKCLYPRFRTSEVVVERFFREAKIAATVEHPNVIQVFDGGDEKDALFLAMELLDGETLAERLERAGRLEISEAVEAFLGIMDGVAAVHSRGVVHRDLKPDNVFLVRPRYGRPQEAKVLDFGISKLKEPGSSRDLTSMGMIMGTPYYMAPEQVASTRDVDARADVYSLGVMLYEALTNDLPYNGENVADIFQAAQEANAPPLHQLRRGVSPALSELVDRAMQPDLLDRFQSVTEMRDALLALELHTTDDEKRSRDAVRMTVRDVPSPLLTGDAPALARSERSREAAAQRPSPERDKTQPPQDEEVPNTLPGRRVPINEEKRSTVQLARPEPGIYAPGAGEDDITIPRWALAVFVAAGVVSIGAIFITILVLVL